jgi:outer membrane protein, heavy metal efflux system
LLFFIFCLFSSASAGAAGLTLEGFLAQVEAANPLLAAAESRASAAERRIGPASAWQDPFFAIGIDEVPVRGMDESSMYRYQLSQTVPFPGKLGAKKRAAEGRAREAASTSAALLRETRILAIQTYYRAIYAQEALRLNGSLQKLFNSTLESLRSRYRTGGDAHHELLLARAELAILQVEKLRLERESETLKARLNELRNLPPETPVAALQASFSPAEKRVAPALDGQPELKAMGAMEAASDAELSAARLDFFPDFMLQGMYMRPRAGGSMAGMEAPKWGAMVGVSLPIYFLSKQSRQVSAARMDREAARLERQSLENRLRIETREAERQLTTAEDVIKLYRESVLPATEMAAKNARSGYAARRMPLADFLSVLKAQRSQELEVLAARIDRELAIARLENLLSSPPLLRFAPGRPSLFMGAGGMPAAGMSGMGPAVDMGRGMSGKKTMDTAPATDSGGMGGMEGM